MEYLVVIAAAFFTFNDVTAVLPPVHYDVTEESPVAAIVGNIMTDAKLYTTLGPDVVKDLRFRITDEDMEQLFTIDDVTGIIQVRKVINREVICPGPLVEVSCTMTFDVAVMKSNPDFYDIVAVTVEVLDINDNIPVFPMKVYKIAIPESANPPVAYNLPLAKDRDTAENGIESYTLQSDSDVFELNVIENSGTIRAVQLVLAKEVDRETKSSYEVSLLAKDGGPTPGELLVNITISDANDHIPKFAKDSYVIYIAEDVPVSSTLLGVQATDKDIGVNSKIVYSLAAASEMYGEQFEVNSNTGEITLVKELDYELTPVYNLIIQAEDGGSNSHQAYCDVMINISDVNDQAPVITINTLAGKSRAEVSEAAEPGQFVAHVSVKDLDTGAGGNFSCYSDNDQFQLQMSSSNRFDLLTAAKLDRELQENITVGVICTDKGSPSLTSSKHLTVSVKDDNDNAPLFTQDSYKHEIEENNLVDAMLLQVLATDADFGENSQVTYSIENGIDYVQIDSYSGLIQASSVFDYESSHEMMFIVKATDHGETPLSSTATVTIVIKDVNDEAPRFSEDIYNFQVKENQVADFEVGRVIASDADSYPHNKVSYSLATDSELFTIDSITGTIKTLSPLDRETKSNHLIEVVASNVNTIPVLSSTCSVSIEVTDVNDNAPVIDFPTTDNDTVVISNFFPKGLLITQVEGHDLDLENEAEGHDQGHSQSLHFKIVSGNDDGYFDIDRETGVIIAVRSLQSITLQMFSLTISVSDDGNPPLGTEEILKIIVDESVPFEGRKMKVGSNLLVVVILSASSVIIALFLVTAIVYIKRRDLKKKQEKFESSRYSIDFERSQDHEIDIDVIGSMMSQNTDETNTDSSSPGGRNSFSSYQHSYGENDQQQHMNSWPRGHQNTHQVQQVGLSSRPLQQLSVLQYSDQRQRSLSEEQDSDSAYSGELSNSDSGRGHSLDCHDCSYGYGSYIEKSGQDQSEMNIGYFDNKFMKIPQTISQMIQNNSLPKTINTNNGNTQNAIEIKHQRPVVPHIGYLSESFSDSDHSLDSTPEDDSSSTSGSYVIDLDMDYEICVPHPVTV